MATNKWNEGNAATRTHALDCHAVGPCGNCRCWCHGITKHLDGSPREDVQEAHADA
jgi:hypothetical protein